MEITTYIVYIAGKAPRVMSVHYCAVGAEISAYNISKNPDKYRLSPDERSVQICKNTRSEFDPVVKPGDSFDNLYGLTEWGSTFSWQSA